jgi:hypothetical protein
MLDILYIAISIGFFALMLAYVRACQLLGERDESKDQTP